ncbi:MAG: hypothetical protein KDB74_01385 [Flavobacteriales bacterium]|nr:hypothetical protein [Flavobacteriales bacterium]
MAIDINNVKKIAEQELFAEKVDKAKEQLKLKLKEIDAAKKVLSNLEAELVELEELLSV